MNRELRNSVNLEQITWDSVGIGSKYKLENGDVLQIMDMGEDYFEPYIRFNINGKHQGEYSKSGFNRLQLQGYELEVKTMNRELRKELIRLKNVIYNEEGISYGEIHFLQCHKQEVLDYGDIRLAEWADITEEEWNNNKLNEEPAK